MPDRFGNAPSISGARCDPMQDEPHKLRVAELHIAELDRRIVRQRLLIEECARLGQGTGEASELLADMEALREEFHRQRVAIEREMVDRG
jgi:hypothetical protein